MALCKSTLKTKKRIGIIWNPSKWDLFKRKIKNYFTKWKLVNTNKYSIEPYPYPYTRFILTPQQMRDVERIYKEKGSMDYIFYYTGIGIGFKVKIWKTNEEIDLTDVSTW